MSKPHIKLTIDGAMLVCTDGSIHFLSLLERMYLNIGLLTIDQLNDQYRTDIPRKP